LLKEYDSIIRDQVEKGIIIEQVSSLEKADKVHYLPHKAVIRKDAVTTKLVLSMIQIQIQIFHSTLPFRAFQ
jgi:hypothetical protein